MTTKMNMASPLHAVLSAMGARGTHHLEAAQASD